MTNTYSSSPTSSSHRPRGPMPDNHKTMAWVSILGCWPLAIVAIVKAGKVDDLWLRGEQEAAEKASASVVRWAIASWVVTALMAIFLLSAG